MLTQVRGKVAKRNIGRDRLLAWDAAPRDEESYSAILHPETSRSQSGGCAVPWRYTSGSILNYFVFGCGRSKLGRILDLWTGMDLSNMIQCAVGLDQAQHKFCSIHEPYMVEWSLHKRGRQRSVAIAVKSKVHYDTSQCFSRGEAVQAKSFRVQ